MIHSVTDGYIVNINKPASWTSFDVVRKLRNITGKRKIGHAGTLDPFATGVLIICIGRATKMVNELMNLPKEYVATIELGKSTDTLDPTGEITETMSIPPLSPEQLEKISSAFVGKIRQKIPAYSAAKTHGTRHYKLARSGKKVPDRYKTVHIHDIRILDFRNNFVQLQVSCSRGTYIRSLGYDIAKKLGTTGYVKELVRTRIGHFNITDALNLEQFSRLWAETKKNENIL